MKKLKKHQNSKLCQRREKRFSKNKHYQKSQNSKRKNLNYLQIWILKKKIIPPKSQNFTKSQMSEKRKSQNSPPKGQNFHKTSLFPRMKKVRIARKVRNLTSRSVIPNNFRILNKTQNYIKIDSPEKSKWKKVKKKINSHTKSEFEEKKIRIHRKVRIPKESQSWPKSQNYHKRRRK